MKIKVSLITTERNERAAIKEFIDSVLEQSMVPDEIIIADGGSNDGTQEIIKSYIKKGAPLKLVVAPGNRSVGRNAAIDAASHEVIAVCDVGCRLDKDWLKNITEPFRNDSDTMMVAGYFIAEPKSHFETVSTELALQGTQEIDLDEWLPSSRSIAFTKTAWEKAGRYPEYAEFDARLARKCGGEDTLFDLALKQAGYNFADGLKAIVYWRPRPNLSSYYQQYYWYAVGDGMDLAGLADHKLFRRLTMTYVLLLVLFVCLGVVYWPLVLVPLAIWGYSLLKRCITPWRKRRRWPDMLLMIILSVAYDLSQIFGYWYGWAHRPIKKSAQQT